MWKFSTDFRPNVVSAHIFLFALFSPLSTLWHMLWLMDNNNKFCWTISHIDEFNDIYVLKMFWMFSLVGVSFWYFVSPVFHRLQGIILLLLDHNLQSYLCNFLLMLLPFWDQASKAQFIYSQPFNNNKDCLYLASIFFHISNFAYIFFRKCS